MGVVDDDAGAFAGEAVGGGRADPPCSAGEDGGVVREVVVGPGQTSLMRRAAGAVRGDSAGTPRGTTC